MGQKTFYFAHNFEDRIEFRQLELQLEKELGIQLFNPFYDDPDRVEEMAELDAMQANSRERMAQLAHTENKFNRSQDQAIDIVRRDLKNLAREGALFTYVKKPSFGTSIEMCNAVMMKAPIYFVSEVYWMHPWIKVYADFRFKSIEEFKNSIKNEVVIP